MVVTLGKGVGLRLWGSEGRLMIPMTILADGLCTYKKLQIKRLTKIYYENNFHLFHSDFISFCIDLHECNSVFSGL
jgi:hypothetical protein